MTVSWHSALSIVAVLVCGSGVRSALAQDGIAVVDQENVVNIGLLDSIQLLGPIGQEFTPSIPGLDVVELWTEDFGGDQGADLQVFIRERVIDGQVIGMSLITSLPDRFRGITEFAFPQLVSLRPGELYVIEVIVVSGDEWLIGDNWAVGSSGGPESTYPDGTWIIQGVPDPGNDLWFREGLASSTPRDKDYCKRNLWQYLTRADGSPFRNQGDCIQYVNTGQ
jgi:hypothetical protein